MSPQLVLWKSLKKVLTSSWNSSLPPFCTLSTNLITCRMESIVLKFQSTSSLCEMLTWYEDLHNFWYRISSRQGFWFLAAQNYISGNGTNWWFDCRCCISSQQDFHFLQWNGRILIHNSHSDKSMEWYTKYISYTDGRIFWSISFTLTKIWNEKRVFLHCQQNILQAGQSGNWVAAKLYLDSPLYSTLLNFTQLYADLVNFTSRDSPDCWSTHEATAIVHLHAV